MAKGPFHFKSFSVEQDGAAMKVGMDGMVLGSWTNVKGVNLAIDIGAGNGYVGLMLLQRMAQGTKVYGVELEPSAAQQCIENLRAQPFAGRTAEGWSGPIQRFHIENPELMGMADLIVSNPPFYKNKPKSLDNARNLARHDDTLSMGDLAQSAHRLLKPGGRLCTIWPSDRLEEWESWSTGMGFDACRTVHIKTMRHLTEKRFLSEWRKQPCAPGQNVQETLILEGAATLDFTQEYLQYIRPYLRGT